MKTNEKDTKQGVVPALRFPEFKTLAPWQTDTVDNLVSTITPPCKLNTSEYQKTGEYPIVDQSQDLYCGWTNNQSAVIFQHFPLIIFGDHTCVIKLINRPFAQGADGIKILKSRGLVDPHFLYQCLENKPITQESYKRHFALLRSKIIAYPPKKTREQQKIAECLSSIDALIKAAENKIDELKAHKKGLMQQLFPAEGKSVPALRFPEFQNAGERKPYKLNDFGSFFRGLTYSTADVSNDNDGIGVLRSTNIQNNRLILDKDLVFVNKTCTSEQRLQKGDVVICMSNGSKALVGKNAELDQDISYNLTVGAFCSIFRPKNVFAKYLLQTDSYTKFVALAIGGGNINNLKNSDLENFVQFAPAKSEEQQKIADCLSSIDNLIIAQTNRLEALKAHKKGLMQQLFPNLNNHKE